MKISDYLSREELAYFTNMLDILGVYPAHPDRG